MTQTGEYPITACAKKSEVDQALASLWGRLLLPSFSDLFFIAITLWLFTMGFGWSQLLMDGDTGWHIRTGEYILQHGSVPVKDIFSWSRPNADWYAWEWLSDVIYAKLYAALGLKGVVLISGLLITGTAAVTLRHMIWRRANAFIALALSLLMVGAASIHYHARPHVFTLFLVAISVWMLAADRERPSPAVWLLVPIILLWTNLHGGFAVLIALIGLTAGGTLLEQVLAWHKSGIADWRVPVRYFCLFFACAAVTLVNPYGYHLHQHMAQYLSSSWIKDVVQEFQSPNFHSESMLQFELLLALGLISILPLARRGRLVEVLWILYFAHQALISARHVTLYVIVISPLIASELSLWWVRFAEKSSPKSVVGVLSQLSLDFGKSFRRTAIWTPAFVVALIFANEPFKWPKDFFEEKFPIKMVDQNSALLKTSRLLTTDQWGDYLLFRFYPSVRVFVDGRSDFYGPEIGKDYLAMLQGGWNWCGLMERYGFDAVLAPVEWPLTSLLKERPEWKVLSDDGKVILFRKVKSDR